MDQLPNILGALILAAILWLVRTTQNVSQELAILQVTVRDNVLQEIVRIRDNLHEVRTIAQGAVLQAAALEVRVTNNEQRIEQMENWDGHERRAGRDRRDGD